MRGSAICFVVGEHCEISGLLECSRGILVLGLFGFFVLKKKKGDKFFVFRNF